MSLESIACFGRPGEELRMLISIVVLGNRSLLTPVTIICAIMIVVWGILAAADNKDLLKKQTTEQPPAP